MRKSICTVVSFVIWVAIGYGQNAPFYPLHVGDRWEFNGKLSKAMKDTMLPNGKMYTMIMNSDTTLGKTRYERFDGTKVFRFEGDSLNEQLWFDFSKNLGDTIYTESDGKLIRQILLYDTLHESIIGKARKVWRFAVYTANADFPSLLDIADSIGIVSYLKPPLFLDSDTATISGATINGALIRNSYPYIYLPLEPGNWWKLDDGLETTMMSIVKDTLMPNGKSYAMQLDRGYATYLRQDKNFVYAYDTLVNQERISMDMSAPAGQIWDFDFSSEGSLFFLVSGGIGTGDVFSTSKRIYSCGDYSPVLLDAGAEEEYADSIGLIGWETMLEQGSLIEAYVNGRHYIATSIKPKQNSLSSEFLLCQNYPNPFNPLTTINYQLPVVSHVTLKIYDVLGREVATLVDEKKSPGTYEVRFDGSRFASGMYFYRLQAGTQIESKKLILIK